jgi:DNA-binding transcriptional ArsR family regulator
MEGVLVVIPRKKPIEFHNGWIAMAQPSMQFFAQIKSLEAQRVVWALLARLDFENYVLVSQSVIADELGMKRPAVSRAIKYLLDEQVLITGPKVGRSITYRLNPSIGWKGSAVNHSKALNERMKANGMSVIKGGKPE